MKLRIRIRRRTCGVELPGQEPSLKDLRDQIQATLLSSHGLSADTEFSLSLNGSELLSDSGQTLSSCGIVPGDLICVVLPESAAAEAPDPQGMDPEAPDPQGMDPEAPDPQAMDPEAPDAEAVDPEPPAPSWEPMLCSEAEDGQAPLSLELLYHTAQSTSPGDAVMVAGNLLMLETGFVPQANELKPGEMPGGWRSVGGAYKLQYTHPLCESCVVTVVGVCMGHVLVINTSLKVNESVDTTLKLCLKPSSYVTDEWPGESAAAAFKDLRKLSRVFKDQLSYPLIAAARAAMKLPVAFGLAALPPELLLRVVRLLDVRSVVRLSTVCRRFNVAMEDSTLWRHLYRRDFTDPGSSRSRDTDWRELYKRFHKLRSDARRVARRRSLPPFLRNPRDIFAPLPLPLPPPLPGIIGGEYDQRPLLPHLLLPRPRYDPIIPPPHQDGRPLSDFRRGRSTVGRAADIRRGFI